MVDRIKLEPHLRNMVLDGKCTIAEAVHAQETLFSGPYHLGSVSPRIRRRLRRIPERRPIIDRDPGDEHVERLTDFRIEFA